MTWFERLTECSEDSPSRVREQLVMKEPRLHSLANGRRWLCGELETPTLAQLRQRARAVAPEPRPLSVREIVADVQMLHANEAHAGALFQVASQFNLLEMASPAATPERGVGLYESDPTQGPACDPLSMSSTVAEFRGS